VSPSQCVRKPVIAVYRPRRPQSSPLYRILEEHFERFCVMYEEEFEREYGPLRPVVLKAVEKYLECGVLESGFARVAWGRAPRRRSPPDDHAQCSQTHTPVLSHEKGASGASVPPGSRDYKMGFISPMAPSYAVLSSLRWTSRNCSGEVCWVHSPGRDFLRSRW